jgi:putative ABC transport system permease protein
MNFERLGYVVRLKFRSLFKRNQVEQELNEELVNHLDTITADLIAKGLSPEEARNQARRQFGGVEQHKEQCRDTRGVRFFEDLLRDIRYGLRSLVQQPGFSSVVICTIAIGIAANAAIFGVVNSVLLRPLPFPESDRLVSVWETSNKFTGTSGAASATRDRSSCAYPNFEDWRRHNQVLERMAAYFSNSFVFADSGGAARLQGAVVSAALFSVLQVQPLLGRGFLEEEDNPGNRSVVLSYGLWQERLGGDRRVLGRGINLDGNLYTVVGVMPADFQFPLQNEAVKLWVTMAGYRTPSPEGGEAMTEQRDNHFISVIARLKPGVTLTEAQANLDTIAAQLSKQYPASNESSGVKLLPLLHDVVGDVRPILLILLGAALCVMLVASANVANLLIARTISRQKQIAIRAALGAGRSQIVRQLLVESLILATAGGIAAVFLVFWTLDAMRYLLPARFPRLIEIAPDWRLALFAVGGVLLVGCAAALGPAWRVAQTDFGPALMESSRGATHGTQSNRLRSTLVVIELMFAVLLLCAGGLLLQSFLRLGRVPPGFDASNVMTARLLLPDRSYPEPAKAADFFVRLNQRVETLPEVESVAAVYSLPLGGTQLGVDFQIIGREVPREKAPETSANMVTPGYFHTLHIALLRGRDFTVRDNEQAPLVTIVSEAFAKKFFPGEDPIGKQLRPQASIHPGEVPVRTIVGVVGDVRMQNLSAPPVPEIYVPHAQFGIGGLSLVVRAKSNANAILPTLKNVVAELDKGVPIYNSQPLSQVVAASIAQPRLNAAIVVGFSLVALLLAAAGILGIMSYAVTQRTRELGIRMALGAQRQQVVWLVVGHSLRLILLGLVLGVGAAISVSRVLQSLLFGIGGTDLRTIIGVSCLLSVVALLASWWPARRASRIDPVIALREA